VSQTWRSPCRRDQQRSSCPSVRLSRQPAGKIGLVLINNAEIPEAVSIKLSGISLTGELAGEQSTATGYWKPFAAFAPSSVTGFTLIVPQKSVTSVGGRL